MKIKSYLWALCAAVGITVAQQEQPTPYDLIRPTFPLTWDTTVFNFFDTSVTKKKNMLPEKTTPFYAPNAFIVDTLKQAYLDAINYHMSPIRLNQAGYLESDKERQFYFIGNATTFEIVDVNGKSFTPAITGNLKPSGRTTSSDWTIIAGTQIKARFFTYKNIPPVYRRDVLDSGLDPSTSPGFYRFAPE